MHVCARQRNRERVGVGLLRREGEAGLWQAVRAAGGCVLSVCTLGGVHLTRVEIWDVALVDATQALKEGMLERNGPESGLPQLRTQRHSLEAWVGTQAVCEAVRPARLHLGAIVNKVWLRGSASQSSAADDASGNGCGQRQSSSGRLNRHGSWFPPRAQKTRRVL